MVEMIRGTPGYDAFSDTIERRRRNRIQDEDRQRRIETEDRERARQDAVREGLWQGLQTQRAQQQGTPQPGQQQPTAPMPAPAQAPGGAAPAAPMPTAPSTAGAQPTASAPAPVPGRISQVEATSDPILEALLRQGPAAAEIAYQRLGQVRAEQAAQAKQQDELEAQAITALGAGDIQTYQYFADKAGMPPLPPEILQNAEMQRLFAAGSKAAQQFYADDPRQAQAYVVAYLQSGGDPVAAIRAAGPPPAAQRGQYSIQTVMDGQDRILAQVDTLRGTAQPITMGGQPVQVPSPTSNTTGMLQTVEWLMANLQLPAAEAWATANQAKQNPVAAYERVWRAVYKAHIDGGFGNEDEAGAAADRAARAFLQSMGVAMPGLGGAPAAPAAAPQQPQAQQPQRLRYDQSSGQFQPSGG